ncbi:unnamed protein product [Adineta steineri]|uniref:Uncharacterized protein n=1 Tax=Adineta steineri TaxID=433720 RepID=A0A815R2L5_9BILA|nr:unnamed protein product [Adineta steineri]CAF1471601.1 unnamed protein product [Adineta steineri]
MPVVDTLFCYKYSKGPTRTKKTGRFNAETHLIDIKNWISSWWKGHNDYHLEIKDHRGTLIDFDDQYIEEYRPFTISQEAQPISSAALVVELVIIEEHDDTESVSTIISAESSNTTHTTTVYQQHHEPSTSVAEQLNNDVQGAFSEKQFSSLCASGCIRINEMNTTMTFTKNVNNCQRDQYNSDQTNVSTNVPTGHYISRHFIPEKARQNYNLLIFILYEICVNGERKLYHHMERHFITNDTSKMNRTALSNDSLIANAVQKKNNPGREPVILPVCDQMLKDDGIEIDLKTTVIPGTKTQSKESRTLFCELTNKYPDDATYETSRLGCLLEKDGEILWDHFLLSNPMIFKKSTCVIEHIPIRDNDKVIEEIPVRIMKRKMDLNQSEIAKRCPSRGEQAQQLDIQTNTSNPVVDQCHHHQMMYTYCQDPSGNAASFSNVHPQVSNLQNEPIQHQYITSFNPSMGFCNPQEMFPTLEPSYSGLTQDSNYQDSLLYQQTEYPPQATSSLPSMNTFQYSSTMTTMHKSQFISTVTRNDEPFTNSDQCDNEH